MDFSDKDFYLRARDIFDGSFVFVAEFDKAE